jgi:hypothetical protein
LAAAPGKSVVTATPVAFVADAVKKTMSIL